MMRNLSNNLDYRQSYKTCVKLITIIPILLALDLFASYFGGGITFKRVLLTLGIFGIFWPTYRYYFKELLYTFWGLSLFPLLYLVLNLLSAMGSNDYVFQSLLLMSISALFFLLVYLASSPLYYPQVSWWEFDYRYRSDLKAVMSFEETENDIRITDIRRKAGSFSSFQALNLGDQIHLSFDFKDKSYEFDCVVGSKSRRILGRPYSYGFQFNLVSKYDKKLYRSLALNWLIKERVKIDDKFNKENV